MISISDSQFLFIQNSEYQVIIKRQNSKVIFSVLTDSLSRGLFKFYDGEAFYINLPSSSVQQKLIKQILSVFSQAFYQIDMSKRELSFMMEDKKIVVKLKERWMAIKQVCGLLFSRQTQLFGLCDKKDAVHLQIKNEQPPKSVKKKRKTEYHPSHESRRQGTKKRVKFEQNKKKRILKNKPQKNTDAKIKKMEEQLQEGEIIIIDLEQQATVDSKKQEIKQSEYDQQLENKQTSNHASNVEQLWFVSKSFSNAFLILQNKLRHNLQNSWSQIGLNISLRRRENRKSFFIVKLYSSGLNQALVGISSKNGVIREPNMNKFCLHSSFSSTDLLCYKDESQKMFLVGNCRKVGKIKVQVDWRQNKVEWIRNNKVFYQQSLERLEEELYPCIQMLQKDSIQVLQWEN